MAQQGRGFPATLIDQGTKADLRQSIDKKEKVGAFGLGGSPVAQKGLSQ